MAAFERERTLLLRTLEEQAGKRVVYFGTCSVFDEDRRDTPYVRHKIEMEALLENSGSPWMVLRLPLAIGPAHRTRTLAQYLHDCIVQGREFEVWAHATRYPIDVADAFRIGSLFIASPEMWNRRINLALRAYRVVEFVEAMQRVAGRKARFHLADRGAHYELECPEVRAVASRLQLDYSDAYLERVLAKYFSPATGSPATP